MNDEITAILSAGKFIHHVGHNGYVVIKWGGPQDKARAWQLARSLGANVDAQPGDCTSCNIEVVNTLRKHIGWPVLSQEVSPAEHSARLAICRVCPVYKSLTHSCGRLILDALTSRTVMVEGKPVDPCGCLVDAKARFHDQKCPAGRWPETI